MTDCHCQTCQLDQILATADLTLTTVSQLRTEMRAMSAETDAIKVTLEAIRADVTGLTAGSATLSEQVTALTASAAALTEQVAVLTAGQDAAVAAAVAPLQAALDDVNSGVADIAVTAAEIDAMTPDAPTA